MRTKPSFAGWIRGLGCLFLASMVLLTAMPTSAAVRFTGSGTNAETGSVGQSAQADFRLVGDILTLSLINTTGVTAEQGDALTGILFDFAVPAVLKLESISLATGSDLWLSQTRVDDSQNLAGSWTDVLASPPRIAASYGLATTGFGGEFKGSSITRGNSSPDYGIVGQNTFPTNKIGGAQYPFVQNGLTFKIRVSPGALTLADLSHVRFLFGTSGTGWIPATSEIAIPNDEIPEPGSMFLLSVAIAAAWLGHRRAVRAICPGCEEITRHP
jgi:hypothetical protein